MGTPKLNCQNPAQTPNSNWRFLRITDFEFQILDFTFLISHFDFRFWISDVRFWISHFGKFLILDSHFWISDKDFWNSDFDCPMPAFYAGPCHFVCRSISRLTPLTTLT